MASPQKENGFTAIANEILEQLVKTDLLASELRVVLFVLRKTYGYQKKEDIISLSQFSKGCDISRPTIVKSIKNLVIKNILVKTALPASKMSFIFNKDYDKWLVKTAKLVKGKSFTSKYGLTRASKDGLTETSKDGLTHKRKKERIKEITKEIDMSASPTTFNQFWDKYPKKELKKRTFEIWKTKKLDDTLQVILDFIDKAMLTDRWKKGFIKQPPAFLNGECWNDDLLSYNDKKQSKLTNLLVANNEKYEKFR